MDKAAAVWTELSLRAAPAGADAVAAVLQELTGAGVAIEPPIEALGPDEGYVLDQRAPLLLKAYMYGEVPPARRRYVRDVLRDVGLTGLLAGRLVWRTLREEDWATSWKQHYGIEHAGRVVIRPAWLEYEPAADEVVVALDPGMAFGTGQHPTTRMCLLAMQEYLQAGDAVLDLGTGSGILGIAALQLGAAGCTAFDIEEQAVAAALANAALNGVVDRINVGLGSIDDLPEGASFDLSLANIHAAAVTALAAHLYTSLKPGGVLFAGGIIEERMEGPLAALREAGFTVERVLADGDWRTVVARKPGA